MKSKNYSEKILDVFKKKGFVFSEPDVLLDSNYIIQRSGENFKKLMLTFEDDTGRNMCLRPDLTVAACVKYLKENSRGVSKIYYSGQAYRRSNNSKESIINDQVGLEIIGSKKKLLDDKTLLMEYSTNAKRLVKEKFLMDKLIEIYEKMFRIIIEQY